ncbi:MAG: DedA family protein [Candidatus Aenigmarchaeota archaeon]|nr:DedA family protein [Candidatus Aenigmarchaeota archaeon]
MFQAFLLWVQAFVLEYGVTGTFIIAFLESFIFPVPTAVIIAPTTGFGLDPFTVTIVATVGSVLGALVGYFLGFYLGHPVAERLFKKHVPRVEKWFDKYGAWAILIAAFSPIPFKVFTWCGGIFRMDIKKFLLASVIGRFFQFLIAAYAGSLLGPWILGFFGV